VRRANRSAPFSFFLPRATTSRGAALRLRARRRKEQNTRRIRFSRRKTDTTMEGQPPGADYGATQQPMGMPPGGQPIVIQQREAEKDNTCCIVVVCLLVLFVCCPIICVVACYCGVLAMCGIGIGAIDKKSKENSDKAASDSSSFLAYPTTATTEARRRRRFEAPQ